MNFLKKLFSVQDEYHIMNDDAVAEPLHQNLDSELSNQFNIHSGRNDRYSTSDHIEISFHACFPELFNIEDGGWETRLTGDEIFEVFDILQIEIDKELITQKFLDRNNRDVEVFHSLHDEQSLVFMDLENDPTDQNDMFFLGIRCPKAREDLVHQRLLDIYKKLGTTSPFTYTNHGNVLYNKVFRALHFFYGGHLENYDRKLNHHNETRSSPWNLKLDNFLDANKDLRFNNRGLCTLESFLNGNLTKEPSLSKYINDLEHLKLLWSEIDDIVEERYNGYWDWEILKEYGRSGEWFTFGGTEDICIYISKANKHVFLENQMLETEPFVEMLLDQFINILEQWRSIIRRKAFAQ